MIKKLLFYSVFLLLALFAISCDELVEPDAITPEEERPVIISTLAQTVSEDGSVVIDVEVENAGNLTVVVVSQPQNGSAAVINQQAAKTVTSAQVLAGRIEYTPDDDFTGPDSFTFNVRDNATGFTSAIATMTITVTGTPDPPVVANGIPDQTVASGAQLTINLVSIGAFIDPDGDALTFTATSENESVATVAINGSVLVVTGVATAADATTITVTASDGGSEVATDSFEVTVSSITNQPPRPRNPLPQTTIALGDTPQTFDLNTYFVDPDGNALTFTILDNSNPNLVTPSIAANMLTLTRLNAGIVSIRVQANDGMADALFPVTFTVINVGGPIAENDSATTQEGESVIIPVLANDRAGASGTGLDPNSVVVVDQPANGSAMAVGAGNISYTPNAGFSGTDTFTYRMADLSAAESNMATVTVVVEAEETLLLSLSPRSQDFGSVQVGASSTRDFTLQNTGTLTLTGSVSLGGPNASEFSITAGGGSYNLNAGATQAITVRFAPTSAGTKTAGLSITHNATNVSNPLQAPLNGTGASAPTPSISLSPSSANFGSVQLGSFSSRDFTLRNTGGGMLTGTISLSGPNAGEFSMTTGGGSYNLNAGATRTITVRFAPTIEGDKNAVLSIMHNANNENSPLTAALSGNGATTTTPAPIAVDDIRSTDEDVPVVITVLSNDVPANGGPPLDIETVQVVRSAINGRVTVNNEGTITYSPIMNFNGEDDFTYTVEDENGTVSNPATVTVTVTAVNDPPSVTNPGAQSSVEGEMVMLQIEASDPEMDALSYNASGLPPGLAIDMATGAISGTVDVAASVGSPYSVTVTVSDGINDAVGVTFGWTITAANDPPSVTNPGAQSSAEGEVVSLQIEATDPDMDVLAYTATDLPPGLAIDMAMGAISGMVAGDAAANSPYSVTVTVSDGINDPVEITFMWTITANDPPAVTNPGPQSDAEDDMVSLQIMASDPEADDLTYIADGLPPNLSIDMATGEISGTVAGDAADNSPYDVTVMVDDGINDPVEITFEWTITAVNQPPSVTNPGAQSSAEGEVVSLQIEATDPDMDVLAYTAIDLPPGLAIDMATGAISGTVDVAASVGSPYSVTVTVSDGINDPAEITFEWTITLL